MTIATTTDEDVLKPKLEKHFLRRRLPFLMSSGSQTTD